MSRRCGAFLRGERALTGAAGGSDGGGGERICVSRVRGTLDAFGQGYDGGAAVVPGVPSRRRRARGVVGGGGPAGRWLAVGGATAPAGSRRRPAARCELRPGHGDRPPGSRDPVVVVAACAAARRGRRDDARRSGLAHGRAAGVWQEPTCRGAAAAGRCRGGAGRVCARRPTAGRAASGVRGGERAPRAAHPGDGRPGRRCCRAASGCEWRDGAQAAAHGGDGDAARGRVTDRDRPGAAPPTDADHSDLRESRRRDAAIGGARVAGGQVMTSLHDGLADYLRIRRGEGVKFEKIGLVLEQFVEFLEERGAERVTVELAVDWATLPTEASDLHRANRLTMVRGFAAYLRERDPVNEIPPWGLLPSGKPRTGRPRRRPVDPAPAGLRAALADYLRIRRALGYKLTKDERALRNFVAFLEACGAARVTTELALDWATLPENAHPASLANRLTMVRQFASYLRTIDPATEVPPSRLLRAGNRRATPYIYTDSEIAALIDAAAMLRYPLLISTYRTLIGLLIVRNTKFGKTRLVPLHATAIEALDDYIRQRRRLYPCPQPRAPAAFISAAGTRLIYNSVNVTFRKLARRAGLQPRSPTCRPRAHDLRHTMAVRTVLDAYHTGADPHARLSVLSTYLGHVNPSNTYWYLSAAPELLALAGERLQQHLDQLGDQT